MKNTIYFESSFFFFCIGDTFLPKKPLPMSLPQWEVLVSLGRTPMKGLLGLLLVQDLFQGYEFFATFIHWI